MPHHVISDHTSDENWWCFACLDTPSRSEGGLETAEYCCLRKIRNRYTIIIPLCLWVGLLVRWYGISDGCMYSIVSIPVIHELFSYFSFRSWQLPCFRLMSLKIRQVISLHILCRFVMYYVSMYNALHHKIPAYIYTYIHVYIYILYVCVHFNVAVV